MRIGVGVAQKQTAGVSPEHILGKSVLKMSLQELQQFLQTQFGENPALIIEDGAECPACQSLLLNGICPTCGSHELSDMDQPSELEDLDWQEDLPASREEFDDSYPEQFSSVANGQSLTDYLKEQIRSSFSEADRELSEFIVDSLDEDGYLREPLLEIAGLFGRSVPQVEDVLNLVQKLDPPGIAARDLRECLAIQLQRLESDSEDWRNAYVLLRDHWDSISRMKLDEAARKTGLTRDQVESALRFIQISLNPYPAAMFRDPWQELAPRPVPAVAPDLVVRHDEDRPRIDVTDPISGRVALDSVYAGLEADMATKRDTYSESDRAHVREYVAKAKSLIEALEFRKSTLRRIVDDVLVCQEGFFRDGPSALKPMTRKEIAARLGVHESTVCRATQDKTLRLPSGDVITFDILFDSALPVKEMVRQLASQRLSDGEIAKRLGEAGIQVARRTVAKYRDQLRVLPIEYRLAR